MRGLVLVPLALVACQRAPRASATAPTASPSGARLSIEATPTCPGDLTTPICDVHVQVPCAAGEHARSLRCRPICVADAGCLVP